MELKKVEFADYPSAYHALKSVNGYLARQQPRFYADTVQNEDGKDVIPEDKLPYYLKIEILSDALFKDNESNSLFAPTFARIKFRQEQYSTTLRNCIFIKDVGRPNASYALKDLHTLLSKEAVPGQYTYLSNRYAFDFKSMPPAFISQLLDISKKGTGTVIDLTWIAILIDVLESFDEKVKVKKAKMLKGVTKATEAVYDPNEAQYEHEEDTPLVLKKKFPPVPPITSTGRIKLDAESPSRRKSSLRQLWTSAGIVIADMNTEEGQKAYQLASEKLAIERAEAQIAIKEKIKAIQEIKNIKSGFSA